MGDLRLYQPSFSGGVLSSSLAARVDLQKYASGLRQANNVFLHPHGGVSNRPGFQFIGEVKASANAAKLIAFQFNTEQTYVLEFGNLYFRVYRDGVLITSAGLPYEVVTPYPASAVKDIVYVQEADVMYLVHPLYAPRKISRLADNNWTITTVTFAPKIAAPTGIAAATAPGGNTSGKPGYTATVYNYKVAAVSEDTGEESLPSISASVTNDLTIQDGKNRVTWSAVTGAYRYIVYREDNGVYGYIGGTEALTFDDANIVPDLADTPQTARNPFTGTGNYPRAVTFFEQRLIFASTVNDPQAVWASQSANYENFGYSSPSKASDAITFRIKAREVNEIRAMIPMKGLLLLTSGAEFLVTGGNASDAITPSAIKIDPQGYRGAARVQPIAVGNTVLFAQARGGIIRDFSYNFADDAFVGKDLTILARHLFEGKAIKAWAYSQAQNSIVWVIMNDGSLISLTYMKEHEVWGWTTHTSPAGAYFEDVVVVAEDDEDIPYFLVRRTINGQTKRYIEKLHTRAFTDIEDAFFVDCGLSYSGTAASTLTGLDHLEGQQVVALSNGNVVRGLTVTGGSVTLPDPTTKCHVGLSYEALIETLSFDIGQIGGLGTIQGRMKSVNQMTLRVENTRGIWTGPVDGPRDDIRLVEWKQRSTEAWGDAIELFTGDLRIVPSPQWNGTGRMFVKQFDPLPFTILAIMPNVELGL